MKAVILLATLKKEGNSNTETLSEFFAEHLKKQNIESEIIKLVNYNILPGTYSDMVDGDEWPAILQKVLSADIIVFATPVWWGNHSSQMQMVIERMDELHDEIMEGNTSKLQGKAGGIIVTGDSDGAEHIIANTANFYNALGIGLPPFASLTVLWEGHAKGKDTPKEELMEKYRKEYDKTAEQMVKQLAGYIK